MNKETRKIVNAVAIGFAVMMVVPLSYRVWIYFHPQPVAHRPSATEFFEIDKMEGVSRLVQTPLSKWSDDWRRLSPAIYAWLEAHEDTILPWEWTDEARRKDPAGYRKLWLRLLDEQKTTLKQRLDSARDELKRGESRLETVETTYTHRTNQIARIKEWVSTNSFPMTVRVERLSKGRFWGWNTKTEDVRLEQGEDFYGAEKGWLASEEKEARAEFFAIADLVVGNKAVAGRIDAIADLCSQTAKSEELEEPDDDACMRQLCRFLNAEMTMKEGSHAVNQ